MADSLRQQIMAALEDQLQLILTGSGYNSNLGSNIYEWRDEPIEEHHLPACIYRDFQDTTAQTFGNQEHRLQVSLDVFANCTAAVMRGIIADVTKCLGENLTLGGLCEDIGAIGNETIKTEYDDRRIFGISIKIEIQFVTANWNPYA